MLSSVISRRVHRRGIAQAALQAVGLGSDATPFVGHQDESAPSTCPRCADGVCSTSNSAPTSGRSRGTMGSSSMTWMHGVWMCGMHTPMIGSKRYMQTVAMPSAPDSEEAMTEFAKALLTAEEGRLALTPQAIVDKLDKHIVGQADAKRAVAIALRNRWRRARLPKVAAEEVMPKNILMIGPTGCGKTEIARRLAKLADAPFIKVE
eukprot:CAMPEP_0202868254 /NCGR_PEP_ID=MMETSP1391-20130828/10599_1 /ASSEMBLY_ACC=CAM_ASM_000867 /TAXON_ID=1034604 /ORGANISM="Chlamydomonas leiostraca, Strain SAG 11-49" /LENGTH=205 /DNA_ID=CAMNT_0049548397 /DNA_START=178 /DNA_END=792 /DNA_ORIENTATION=+